MGGAITTLYAIDKKPALRGLLLSGAALKVDVSGFKVFATKVIAGLAPGSGVFQLDVDDFSRDPKVVAATKADPLVYQDAASAHTAKELVNAIDRIQDKMEAVTVPLLIMHGGADQVTPPQGSRDLQARAHTTDKTLQIYPGLYHDLLHEPEKDRVEADVVKWVTDRIGAK
jgi:alpha-beta hydrolase superfamily lysophospholipase